MRRARRPHPRARTQVAAALAWISFLALSASARAADLTDAAVGYRVTIPDEIPAVPELTEAVVRDFADQARYGGTPFRSNGRAFADRDKGIGLYVLWLTTQKPIEQAADRIRDELEAKAKRPEATDAKADLRIDERLASTRVEYQSPKNGTRTLLRSIAFVDRDSKIHEVTVECVLRGDAGADVVALCESALGSLDVTLPEAQRAPIGTPGPRLADEGAGAGGAGGAGAGEAATAATPVDPSAKTADGAGPAPAGGALVTNEVAPKKSRWPFVLGGAAVVILAIALAARRRKRSS